MQEVRLAVQGCVSAMALAYGGVTGPPALIVESLILENISSVSIRTCHCVVAFCSVLCELNVNHQSVALPRLMRVLFVIDVLTVNNQ